MSNAAGVATTNSIPLTNLQPGVSYVVQVQAQGVSQAGDTSNWSVGYIFVVPNL